MNYASTTHIASLLFLILWSLAAAAFSAYRINNRIDRGLYEHSNPHVPLFDFAIMWLFLIFLGFCLASIAISAFHKWS